jgi:hypothetical protein
MAIENYQVLHNCFKKTLIPYRNWEIQLKLFMSVTSFSISSWTRSRVCTSVTTRAPKVVRANLAKGIFTSEALSFNLHYKETEPNFHKL